MGILSLSIAYKLILIQINRAYKRNISVAHVPLAYLFVYSSNITSSNVLSSS